MSPRTITALVAVTAGGWIALANRWMSDRRRLHAAEAELARLRSDRQPVSRPPHLRGDSDMASEWEQAVAPMDS